MELEGEVIMVLEQVEGKTGAVQEEDEMLVELEGLVGEAVELEGLVVD